MSRPSSSDLGSALVRASSFHNVLRARAPESHAVTSLRFALPHDAHATVRVVDAHENDVRVLLEGELRAGEHRCCWDGRGISGFRVPPGEYTIRLEVDGGVLTSRLVTLRERG